MPPAAVIYSAVKLMEIQRHLGCLCDPEVVYLHWVYEQRWAYVLNHDSWCRMRIGERMS